MNPLINTQHNPFADVPAQTQTDEIYSYSGVGLFTFSFFFGASLFFLGYLIFKGANLKIGETVFLGLWITIVGLGITNWSKSFHCDTEGVTVFYWVRPSKRLFYTEISAVEVKLTRGIATTIYRDNRKPFCLFEMSAIRDSKKLVKTIVERANLTFQKGNDRTGDALFVRLP
ncbi:MAG: hypothetical protein Fur0022_21200 [Anaerolineales bacterium]